MNALTTAQVRGVPMERLGPLVVVTASGERYPLRGLVVAQGQTLFDALEQATPAESEIIYDPRRWLVFAPNARAYLTWLKTYDVQPSMACWAGDKHRVVGLEGSKWQPAFVQGWELNEDVREAREVWRAWEGR